MRLYPKQINSIEELRLEKQKLLNASKQTDIKHLLSFDGIIFPKRSEKEENEDSSPSIADGLFKEGTIAETLLNLAMPALQKAGIKVGAAGKEYGKKIITSAAKELVGGYLKWKAIEWSLKGLFHFISSRKKKKATKILT
jgi:hypothetical protein